MGELRVMQHDDGTWYARPYMGTNRVTGKPWRPYKRFPSARSEAEALVMAREWASTLAGAADMHVSLRLRDLLCAYLRWMESSGAKAETVRTYRSLVRAYVVPHIGDADADELRPRDIESLYAELMARGARDGSGLSARTVAKLHWFLRGAYRWMVRQEIVPFDPMPSVVPPKARRREAFVLSRADASALAAELESVMGSDGMGATAEHGRECALAAYLSLRTGLRVGEVCALRAADVDAARSLLHVGGTLVNGKGGPVRQDAPKSASSVRNVALDAETLGWLDAHMRRQRSALEPRVLRDRTRFLLCRPDGSPLSTGSVSRWFSDLRDRMGLPAEATFHTLRHTHATLLLMAGVDMRTVSERLGHSKVATTMEIYAHVLPGRDADAAARFGTMIGEGL